MESVLGPHDKKDIAEMLPGKGIDWEGAPGAAVGAEKAQPGKKNEVRGGSSLFIDS